MRLELFSPILETAHIEIVETALPKAGADASWCTWSWMVRIPTPPDPSKSTKDRAPEEDKPSSALTRRNGIIRDCG